MIHLQAKKSLGQNFLIDPTVHQRIVEVVDPGSEDTLIEIGPGTGLLTRHLLASPLKKLLAYELDHRAIPELRKEFAGHAERFEVIEQDFLQADLRAISDAVASPLRIVGNIPYYITSPILFKLLEEDPGIIVDATLLVQLEVAERLAASPRTKAYGIPTILSNFLGEVHFCFKVPASAFRPVPNVDSAVVHIDMRRAYFERTKSTPPSWFTYREFQQLVKQSFAMRRKMLRNNLKSSSFKDAVALLESHPSASRYLSQRAEELTIEDYLQILEILRS